MLTVIPIHPNFQPTASDLANIRAAEANFQLDPRFHQRNPQDFWWKREKGTYQLIHKRVQRGVFIKNGRPQQTVTIGQIQKHNYKIW